MNCVAIYTISDISQIQLTTLLTNVFQGLNHVSFDNSYLKLCLQEIQDTAHIEASILEKQSLLPTIETLTYTSQAILAIHKLNIKFTRPLNAWPITAKL